MNCTSGCFDLPCPPPCPPQCNCTTNDIKYKGTNDLCTGVMYDMFLTEVLQKLATFAKNRLFSVVPSTSIAVTPALTTCNKSAQVSVIISSDADNALAIRSNGLYATDSGGSTPTPYTADRGIVENVSHNFRLVEFLDGAATKFLWNFPKGAFRAGTTTGNKWDNVNIANYSVAFGFDTQASGIGSFAGGSNSTSTGVNSIVYGNTASAVTDNSAAFGIQTHILTGAGASFVAGSDITIAQAFSTSFGRTNSIEATTAGAISLGVSFVAGAGNHAHGQNNIILGGTSITHNDFNIALGLDHELSGDYGYAFGRNLLSATVSCVVTGVYNNTSDEAADTVDTTTVIRTPAFIVGNGHVLGSPPSETRVGQNGMIIYKSGTVRIYGALDQRGSTRGIIPARWTTVNRPASPLEGEQGYNLTDHIMEYYNGTTWIQF